MVSYKNETRYTIENGFLKDKSQTIIFFYKARGKADDHYMLVFTLCCYSFSSTVMVFLMIQIQTTRTKVEYYLTQFI